MGSELPTALKDVIALPTEERAALVETVSEGLDEVIDENSETV